MDSLLGSKLEITRSYLIIMVESHKGHVLYTEAKILDFLRRCCCNKESILDNGRILKRSRLCWLVPMNLCLLDSISLVLMSRALRLSSSSKS